MKASHHYESIGGYGLSFSPKCVACQGFASLLSNIKSRSIDAIKTHLDVFCEYSFFFRSICRSFIDNQLDSLLRNATESFDAERICTDILHVCGARSINLPTINNPQAPTSRTSILLPGDGGVQPQGSFVQMRDLNYDRLIGLLGDEVTSAGKELTLKFLARHGLIANSHLCDKCRIRQAALVKYNHVDGYRWRCNNCRYSSGEEIAATNSVRMGSFFHNSHLSFRQILKIIYYWSEFPTASLEQVMKETDVAGQHTIVDWYNFIRDLTQSWADRVQTREKLGGYDIIVECDESKFYRAKYQRGRMLQREASSGWVFGCIQRGTSKIRLFPVERRDAATLLNIIGENIERGTIICTDGWAAYGGLFIWVLSFKGCG